MTSASQQDMASLEFVIGDDRTVAAIRASTPKSLDAAATFWRVPVTAGSLSPRMVELVLLAMHATATTVNAGAVERHVGRARAAGATPEDILDVLLTIVGVANHALYDTVPILEEELAAAGVPEPDSEWPTAEFEAAKSAFVALRGFWNPDRELFARLMPEYSSALDGVATTSWESGSLTAKERELVCIGVDCTVTHVYEIGLRRHIRNAIGHGASRAEILQVFQLAALLGLEGYVIGARALFGGNAD
jgi:alkylhydroperoxidase/carboxymuconolactone decarboxylase family protein YurZ